MIEFLLIPLNPPFSKRGTFLVSLRDNLCACLATRNAPQKQTSESPFQLSTSEFTLKESEAELMQ
ncbi:MAG: hypothetical protein ACI9CB_002709 [Rhodothermales bacterium]|jgi:hypothetical protein